MKRIVNKVLLMNEFIILEFYEKFKFVFLGCVSNDSS